MRNLWSAPHQGAHFHREYFPAAVAPPAGLPFLPAPMHQGRVVAVDLGRDAEEVARLVRRAGAAAVLPASGQSVLSPRGQVPLLLALPWKASIQRRRKAMTVPLAPVELLLLERYFLAALMCMFTGMNSNSVAMNVVEAI